MTWLNPWAWTGLVAIALPVLIHLLGQQPARRQRFPTLRFIGESRPLPTRRTRVHDLILLALRCGAIVAAVMALAQPQLRHSPHQAADHSLARAIIIDRSASMLRRAAEGGTALTVAERVATRLSDSAQSRTMLVAEDPAAAIPGALAWLARQSGRSELMIISDFQAGTLDAAALAAVPARIGVRFVRVAVVPTDTLEIRSAIGDQDLLARATLALPDRTTSVAWLTGEAATSPPHTLIALAGADEAPAADAASQAARSVPVPLPIDTTRAVAIVYPHAAERQAMRRAAVVPHASWMADLLARLRHDPLLAQAAADATIVDTASPGSAFVLARTRSGQPAVLATEATLKGAERLVLLPLTDADALTSAALIAALSRSLSLAPSPAERNPLLIADSTLARWQRPAGPGTVAGRDDSEGRWFWVLALLLLGAEFLFRRPARAAAVVEARDAVS
jgi:hypothetical protein